MSRVSTVKGHEIFGLKICAGGCFTCKPTSTKMNGVQTTRLPVANLLVAASTFLFNEDNILLCRCIIRYRPLQYAPKPCSELWRLRRSKASQEEVLEPPAFGIATQAVYAGVIGSFLYGDLAKKTGSGSKF